MRKCCNFNERRLPEIAKISAQQENQFPQTTKNCRFAKMNSRKNLVPQGTSKQHIQFKTREQKPYPSYDQKGQNQYPIYE